MRSYMAIRTVNAGVLRFSVFGLEQILKEDLDSYLPPFVYTYHFDEHSPRFRRYMDLESLRHPDGIALGAFPRHWFTNAKNAASDERFMGWELKHNDIYPVYEGVSNE